MDDTLLTDDHKISERRIDALKAQDGEFMLFWLEGQHRHNDTYAKSCKWIPYDFL
jgi:hydroxymethylpyrimidine pyrophosphatase-like HAD family hydrolase